MAQLVSPRPLIVGPFAVLLLVVIMVVNCVSSEGIFWRGVFSPKLNVHKEGHPHIPGCNSSARVGFGK
jgi:hypothetical protein